MSNLRLSRETRLLLLAPHPDDESLGCGVILQRAVRARAAIRVLYATDGDNNPWPQRALERKWLLSTRDRERWGRLRRMEARAALRELGISRNHSQFLGLPDQGLTQLVRRSGRATKNLFRDAIVGWRPTLLLVPSIHDTHPDHRAIGLLIRTLEEELCETLPALAAWSYKIHGRRGVFARQAITFSQTPAETAIKLAAIRCHKTQLALSGRRFLRYANRPEQFQRPTSLDRLVPCLNSEWSELR